MDDTFNTSKFYELLHTEDSPLKSATLAQSSPLRTNGTNSRFFPSPIKQEYIYPTDENEGIFGARSPKRKITFNTTGEDIVSPLKKFNLSSPKSKIGSGQGLLSSPPEALFNSIPHMDYISSDLAEIKESHLDVDDIVMNVPKSPLSTNGSPAAGGSYSASSIVLHHIHETIIRHTKEIREYTISLPNTIVEEHAHDLIKETFYPIGQIDKIKQQETDNNDEDFAYYTVLSTTFVSPMTTTLPWNKTIKFSQGFKMVIKFIQTLNKDFKPEIDIPSAKFESSGYPEGFSSSLHERQGEFVYSREMPVKLRGKKIKLNVPQ